MLFCNLSSEALAVFLVRLQTTFLLSCIVIDIWFVLWLFLRLNNSFFFIVLDICFALWSFSSLNNLFFIIVIDTFEEKLALWDIMKWLNRVIVHWLLLSNNLILYWVTNLNFPMGISQWSWLRISPDYTGITYSLQEHLFHRTLLVAVLVYCCLSTVWLIQHNYSFCFLHLYRYRLTV